MSGFFSCFVYVTRVFSDVKKVPWLVRFRALVCMTYTCMHDLKTGRNGEEDADEGGRA